MGSAVIADVSSSTFDEEEVSSAIFNNLLLLTLLSLEIRGRCNTLHHVSYARAMELYSKVATVLWRLIT